MILSTPTPQGNSLQGEQIRDENPHAPPVKEWETPTPKTTPLVQRIRHHFKMGHPFANGILAGKTVYVSPGHGWTWTRVSGSYIWTTQRGWSYAIVEDLANAESVDQFLIPCLQSAGAYVVPVRESDLNTNMVIVDNDDSGSERGVYREEGDSSLIFTSQQSTYGYQATYTHNEEPFRQGTNRLIKTSSTETARAIWVPNVPADGYYNVYVSYSAWSTRAPDAHYIVRTPGGETHFRVDQRRHGRTWVLLGRFWFDKGQNEDKGAVILANDSSQASADVEVSADAVRLGGGMGLSLRNGSTSGHPRWEESCVTHAQFMGAPTSVYGSSSSGDRTKDIGCRSRFAAWDHESGEDAVYVAWHTNSGGGRGTSTYIYGHNPPDGSYNPDAVPGSDQLAFAIQDHMVAAFREYTESNWRDRGVFSAYFGELNPNNNGETPSALVEVLFHDSRSDTDWYKIPFIRYMAARQVCYAVIDYFAQKDGKSIVYPPEPPVSVAAFNAGPGRVTVSWQPPPDMPELGDPADGYMVYMGPNAHSFDEGTYVEGTTYTLDNVPAGSLLFFKVTAVNAGGESVSSSPVAVYTSRAGKAQVLLVDAFDALTRDMAPMIDDGYSSGAVFRMILEKMNFWREGIGRHAKALAQAHLAFDSMQVEAIGLVDWNTAEYQAVDVMAGRGTTPDSMNALTSWLQAAFAASVPVFVNGSSFGTDMIDQGLGSRLSTMFGLETVSEGDESLTFSGVLDSVPSSQISTGDGFYDARPTEAYVSESAPASYDSGSAAGVFASNSSGFILGAPLEAFENSTTRVELLHVLMTDVFGVEELSDATDPGDGTGTDPGDGTGTDPGDGTGTDPGDGTGTDPGDGTDTNNSTDTRNGTNYEAVKTEYGLGCACTVVGSSKDSSSSLPALLLAVFAALIVMRRRSR